MHDLSDVFVLHCLCCFPHPDLMTVNTCSECSPFFWYSGVHEIDTRPCVDLPAVVHDMLLVGNMQRVCLVLVLHLAPQDSCFISCTVCAPQTFGVLDHYTLLMPLSPSPVRLSARFLQQYHMRLCLFNNVSSGYACT